MRSVYVSLTCLHEASQASLHHGGSAVDVLLLRLQRRQLTQHVLAGVLQTLTTSRITHTHTHEHTQDEWPTATERGMEMEEDKKKKKKKVKGLERGQRNGKRNAEGSQSSKWFVYNRFKVIQSLLQPWVMLMTFVWFDLRVTVMGKSKEEKKHEARNE